MFEGTDEEVAAAAKIQAMHRGKNARAELDKDKAAITRIQAMQRGKTTRRAEGKKKASKKHIGSADQGDLIKLAFESLEDTSSRKAVGESAIGAELLKAKWSKDKFAAWIGGPAAELECTEGAAA